MLWSGVMFASVFMTIALIWHLDDALWRYHHSSARQYKQMGSTTAISGHQLNLILSGETGNHGDHLKQTLSPAFIRAAGYSSAYKLYHIFGNMLVSAHKKEDGG